MEVPNLQWREELEAVMKYTRREKYYDLKGEDT